MGFSSFNAVHKTGNKRDFHEGGGGGDIPLMQHTRLATSRDFNGRVSVPLMLHKRLTTNGAFILFKYVNELC